MSRLRNFFLKYVFPDALREIEPVYPMPTSIDSIYACDIDVDNSDIDGFSGVITDFFDDLFTVSDNLTATNPKVIKIWFKHSIQLYSMGFGCNEAGKNFSNIKIKLFGSNETIREIIDESADSTKYTSKSFDFGPTKANGAIIEFHTADPVSLSNIIVWKSLDTNARVLATKPNGHVVPISASDHGNLNVSVSEFGDTPSIDAFARMRVSQPFTIFDSKQIQDKQPLFWDESIGGSATSVHQANNAAVRMTVTASASDFVIRQTKQRFNYQPGKSHLVYFTFRSPQSTGVTCRTGLFDGTGANYLTPNNGIFFECDGSIAWKICKNGTTTETALQADWNVDKLDGTGNSGIDLDFTATQIGVIDFEYLGVGRVRVGFVIDGLIYYCHYFNHANNPAFTSVYMSTPNLPLRYSIQSDGSGGGNMDHLCSTVISEGGQEKTGILRVADTGIAGYVTGLAANTDHAIVGIRLKSAYKDITVIPESVSMISGTKNDFRWSVQLNPTVAGVFTYSDITNSACQRAIGTSSNTITTPGTILASGYSQAQSNVTQELITALRIGASIAGTMDTLVVCIAPFGAASIAVSLNFRELL